MVERYNGGIKITIGNYEIKRITSYTISDNPETENFQKWDGSTFSQLKGYRKTISVTTGWVTLDEMTNIKNVLSGHCITITDTDKNFGESGASFYVTSVSNPLVKADIYGKFYQLTFAASSVDLFNGSGSL